MYKFINKIIFTLFIFFGFMPVVFSKEYDINDYVPDEIEAPMIDNGAYMYNYSQCDLFREYSDKVDEAYIHFEYVYYEKDNYKEDNIDYDYLDAYLHEERFCDARYNSNNCIIDSKRVKIKYKEKDEDVYKTINDLVKRFSFEGSYSGVNYIDFLHKAGFDPYKTKIEDALLSFVPNNIKNDVSFVYNNNTGNCYLGGRGDSSYATAFYSYNYSDGFIKYKDIYYDYLYSYYNYNRVMFLPYGTSYDDIIDVAKSEVKKLDNNSKVTVTKLDKKVGDYYKGNYYDFVYDNYCFDNEFSKNDNLYDVCIDDVCASMAIVPKKNVKAIDRHADSYGNYTGTGIAVVAPISEVGEEISVNGFRPDYWDLQDGTYFDDVKDILGTENIADMFEISLDNGVNSIEEGFFDISFSFSIDYDDTSRINVYYITEDGEIEKYDVVTENIYYDKSGRHLITKHLGKYYIVPCEKVMGDLNDDGSISLSDVLLILKCYFNKDYYDGTYERSVADINGDNEVNLTDILLLLKMFFYKNNN